MHPFRILEGWPVVNDSLSAHGIEKGVNGVRYTYDLHLHSCLSPCGDEEMTPANLVNMAALLGLDIIALTDHNTAGNCRSAIEAGKRAGILVIPGMELCTAEEIHVVCLFPTLEQGEEFAQTVYQSLPPVQNRPHIYGRQLRMDAADGILGEEPLLLVTASGISIDHVSALVSSYGGICYPAHIDRASFSVLSSFGVYPEHLQFPVAEISRNANVQTLRTDHPALERTPLIRASDAHHLEDIMEPEEDRVMELPQRTAAAVLDWLRGRTP